MSLLFSSAQAAKNTSVALASGAFWFAAVCLASVIARLVIDDWGARMPVLASLCILAVIGGGAVLVTGSRRSIGVLVAVAVLLAVSIAVYTWAITDPTAPGAASDALSLTTPAVCVTLLGVVAGRHFNDIASLVIAFVIGYGVLIAVAGFEGRRIVFDGTVFGFFAVTLVVLVGLKLSRRKSRSGVPTMIRAVSDDREDHDRDALARSASALVHDTILGELAVVSLAPTGELGPEAHAHLAASLGTIESRDWLRSIPAPDESGFQSTLGMAVSAARAGGLAIDFSGDIDELRSISQRAATALGRAVGECLSNVAKHSGVDRAEVVVVAADDHISVMVIDGGRGFDEQSVSPERLGLRHSVRARIAEVAGVVQLWSTPGAGTSVVITVPRS